MASLVRRIERPAVVLLLHLLRALARPARAARGVEPRAILVIRVDERVGNVLLTTPLVAPLRRRFPGARLVFLVARSKLDIVRGVVDAIPFEKKDAFRAPLRFLGALWALRGARFDVAIDASHAHQWSVTSSLLLGWIGAPIRIAHDRGRAAITATEVVPPVPDDVQEIEGKLSLLAPLGLEAPGARMHTELGAADPARATIAAWRAEATVGPLVGLVPGGRKRAHRVDASVFVAAALRARSLGATPVVLWGPGEEALAARVRDEGQAVLAPPTDLEQLAALMRACAAIVSNDTGPMHLAVAVGTPTIGVFAQPQGRRWGHDYPPHRVVHAAGRDTPGVAEEVAARLAEVLGAR